MSEIAGQLREVAGITTGLLYSRRKLLNDAADHIAALEAVKATVKPIGYVFELARSVEHIIGEPKRWCNWGKPQFSFDAPNVPDGSIRNLCPVYGEPLEANLQVIETLRAALTPSAETKSAYMGEFSFPKTYTDEYGDEISVNMSVPWTTIKEIMKAISARVAAISDKGAVS
jgi:hypothetical protein